MQNRSNIRPCGAQAGAAANSGDDTLVVTLTRGALRALITEAIAELAPSPDKPALRDTSEICRELGISAPTLKKWVDAGRVPCIRMGDVVRYELDAVLAALRAAP